MNPVTTDERVGVFDRILIWLAGILMAPVWWIWMLTCRGGAWKLLGTTIYVAVAGTIAGLSMFAVMVALRDSPLSSAAVVTIAAALSFAECGFFGWFYSRLITF